MTKPAQLIKEVENARNSFIQSCKNLSPQQYQFKSAAEKWSILEVAEHIVWAERAGVVGMWKVLEERKHGANYWSGDNPNEGLSIEEVVEKTWKPKEEVPDVARPRWGGALAFWLSSLESCSHTLEKLGKALEGEQAEKLIYPHPISGPLNIIQRLEFLAFHLNRHQKQIEDIKSAIHFPSS
ncbi:MAG: DinB family protein [Bacteroidia bacterium]|nr:DinB family protein [Bacteroidia bacterium]